MHQGSQDGWMVGFTGSNRLPVNNWPKGCAIIINFYFAFLIDLVKNNANRMFSNVNCIWLNEHRTGKWVNGKHFS